MVSNLEMNAEREAIEIVTAIMNRTRPRVLDNLYIDDLIQHALEFQQDYEMLSAIGEGFPCIRRSDDTLTPISIGSPPLGGLYPIPWTRILREGLSPYLPEGSETELQVVEPEKAEYYFRIEMANFLSSRIRSLFQDLKSDIERVKVQLPTAAFFGLNRNMVQTSGFRVEVSASPNLRVFVSPKFRRKWRYFSYPTSPAIGTLIGGIYEFAVDGGPYHTLTPDSGIFDIPYTTVTPALAL